MTAEERKGLREAAEEALIALEDGREYQGEVLEVIAGLRTALAADRREGEQAAPGRDELRELAILLANEVLEGTEPHHKRETARLLLRAALTAPVPTPNVLSDVIDQMKRSIKNCMRSEDAGECVATSSVEYWIEQLEADPPAPVPPQPTQATLREPDAMQIATSMLAEQIVAIPEQNHLHANRYDTDDSYKLIIWDDGGNNYDISIPRAALRAAAPQPGSRITPQNSPLHQQFCTGEGCTECARIAALTTQGED